MKSKPCLKSIVVPLVALSLVACSAHALIVGPYSADADTLHLWHLDEAAAPCVDSAVGGTNLTALFGGATLNNASFTGFGTALNTRDLGQADITTAGRDAYLACRALANSTADNTVITFADPATGAFTIEAIVHIEFDPALNLGSVNFGGNGRAQQLQILSGEDEANPGRIFQFRIDPIGLLGTNLPTQPVLEFINVRQAAAGQVQNITTPIPTNGVDAIVSNGWYHVAVTYDGNQNTTDNCKLYWTLMDGTRTSANLILSTNLVNDLSVAATDFSIGNIGRNPSQSCFLGLIDEVRVSKVARPSGGMQFVPPLAIAQNPSDQVVALTQPATFTVQAVGLAPIGYQWRHHGTNIPGAAGASYTIASTALVDAGPYDVVVTNLADPPATSLVATLTIYVPRGLTWAGTGADWDTTTANWTTNANTTQTTYTELDDVTFDSLGGAQPNVNLTATRTPFAVTVNASADYAFNGSGIAGLASLTKSGSGKLTLNAANTYSGPTTINAGTVQLDNAGTIGSGPVTNNGNLVINTSVNADFPGAISGSGNLTVLAGSASLGGNNSYTGPTVISGGTLLVLNGSALGGSSSGTSVSNSAQLYINANVDIVGEALTLNGAGPASDGALRKGGGTTRFGGTVTLQSDTTIKVDGGATLNLTNSAGVTGANVNLALAGDAGANGTITGPVSLGSGSVAKNTAGTWTLASTANAWTGGTIINAGTLQIGDGVTDGSLPTQATPILVNGTLAFNGVNPQIYSHEFNGIGGVTKNGSNTVTLTATNTYSGPTTVNGGTLIPGNEGALGDAVGNTVIAGNFGAVSRVGLTGGLSLAEPMLLQGRQPAPDPSAFAAHIINLSGTNTLAGPITATTGGNQYNIESAADLLIVAADYSQASGTGDRILNLQGAAAANWTGAINNGTANVVLVKRGTGVWTLSGANTYSGATAVSNGTLIVNGSIGQGLPTNAVTVYSGGTLGGNGTVNAPVTVQSGGNLAPGVSIGLLTVSGNLTLASGSSASIELNEGAGTNDQVAVSGTVAYGGTLNVTNLSGTIAANDSFTLFTAANHSGNFSSISGSPGPGLGWLFSNGVLTAITVASGPTNISFSFGGGALTLTWPGSHLGWILQSQTNSLSVGISTNWTDLAGSSASTQSVMNVNPAAPTVFFRLRHP